MKKTTQKTTQLKPSDFINQKNGYNLIDLNFLKGKGVFLTAEEGLELGSLLFFEKGEQIENKKGSKTYLTPIGIALHDFSNGATMFGDKAMADLGKSIFKKFYPDKYDFFF